MAFFAPMHVLMKIQTFAALIILKRWKKIQDRYPAVFQFTDDRISDLGRGRIIIRNSKPFPPNIPFCITNLMAPGIYNNSKLNLVLLTEGMH